MRRWLTSAAALALLALAACTQTTNTTGTPQLGGNASANTMVQHPAGSYETMPRGNVNPGMPPDVTGAR